jgi:hypothetical protein
MNPRRVLLVPRVSTLLKHSRDVIVLHEHGVVLLNEPRRELVLEVFDLPLDYHGPLTRCINNFK